MDLDYVPTVYFSLTSFITFELKTDIELLILINHPTEISEVKGTLVYRYI